MLKLSIVLADGGSEVPWPLWPNVSVLFSLLFFFYLDINYFIFIFISLLFYFILFYFFILFIFYFILFYFLVCAMMKRPPCCWKWHLAEQFCHCCKWKGISQKYKTEEICQQEQTKHLVPCINLKLDLDLPCLESVAIALLREWGFWGICWPLESMLLCNLPFIALSL